MQVLVEKGAVVYQRPGEIKIYVLGADTWFQLWGGQNYNGQSWTEIGDKRWVESRHVIAQTDEPIPEPPPEPEPVVGVEVLIRKDSIIRQTPGGVKITRVASDTWMPFYGYRMENGVSWAEVGDRRWTEKSNIIQSRSGDNPPPPPPDPGEPPEPPSPVEGNLWFVEHDMYPRVGKIKGSTVPVLKDGFPETNGSGEGGVVPVTSALRELIIAVHCLLHPEMSESAVVDELRKLFRSNGGWCNGRYNGWDAEFKIDALYPGGWTASLVDSSMTPPTRGFVGRKCVEAYCMQLSNLDPIPNSIAEIKMNHWAFPTTARLGGSGPFPNFAGRCLIPIVRKAPTTWLQWVNLDRALAGLPTNALRKVATIQQPHWPPLPSITAGLIV